MTESVYTPTSRIREYVKVGSELFLVTILWQLHISFPQTDIPNLCWSHF